MWACVSKNRTFFCVFILCFFLESSTFGFYSRVFEPRLSARSAIVVDSQNGHILYSKNAFIKLPPASTAKVMTAVLALERLPWDGKVLLSERAVNTSPSKAGLSQNVQYAVKDLILAVLVSSSNDAAVGLSEAVSGSEAGFVDSMNEKARQLGMANTRFANATGLPTRGRFSQYSTAYDLSILMRYALRDPRLDPLMGVTTAFICGSDGKWIFIKSHNKMLWRNPGFVKGKTGWTCASRHTFVGTDYAANKKIVFAMLSSKKPWLDIERLATFGLLLKRRG